MRVKTGTVRRAKHKKILKQAKGFKGRRNSVFKLAKQGVIKAGQYAYRDRRNKKREFRAKWILQINAFARANDTSYSELIAKLKSKNVTLNRKMISYLAKNEPEALKTAIDSVK